MSDGTTPQAGRTYAGKYQSPEALESGYNELFRYNQKTVAERKALEERNRLLEATLTQLQSQNLGGGSDDDNPLSGLSVEQFKAIVMPLVEAGTAENVQRILDPLLKGAEAVTYFGPDNGPISKFLQETPEIQTTFQSMVGANPEGAARYAQLEYQKHISETQESGVKRATQETTARREAELSTAALPPSRSMGRGTPDPNADHAERVEKAWDKAQKTGNATEYARLRLNEGAHIQPWFPGEPPPPEYLRSQAEERT